jgi:hypothetical protein
MIARVTAVAYVTIVGAFTGIAFFSVGQASAP